MTRESSIGKTFVVFDLPTDSGLDRRHRNLRHRLIAIRWNGRRDRHSGDAMAGQ